MGMSTSSTYQVGQIVMARVERVTPFGVHVRRRVVTPAYVRRHDLTRGGHWDPNCEINEPQVARETNISPGGRANRNLEPGLQQRSTPF
jgi:hypothetical protein